MSPVKYIVLKVGRTRASMTLASIHPAGKKDEAHRNAKFIRASEHRDVIVATVDTYYSFQTEGQDNDNTNSANETKSK